MARIYVFNLGLHGHINPTLGLMEALVAGGDDVTYFAPAEFKSVIEATGVRFESYDSAFHRGEAFINDGTQRPMPLRLAEDCTRAFPNLATRVLKGPRPDCIIYDVMCLPGRILAQAARVPHVRVSPSYMMNETFTVPLPFPQDPETLKTFDDYLRPIFQELDIVPFSMTEIFRHIAPLNISFIPRAFQQMGETFDGRFIFAGPAPTKAREKDATDFDAKILEPRPAVYISLGTVFNSRPEFFEACLEAFKDPKYTVLMSLGNRIDPAVYAKAPWHFHVRSFVPQTEVLKHTDVFVTHAGMNSVQEAFYRGVPMVLVPQMHEQSMNAQRVDELGAGIALDPAAITPKIIRDSVDRIYANPEFRVRSSEMGEQGRLAGGAMAAAQGIWDYLARA